MLEEVSISGLGVIDDAVMELAPGLTVLTGETGAGKTMVLQGLGMLFGGRADPTLVRPGAARASVEGRLALTPGNPAIERAVAAGADFDDDGVLLVSRTLTAQGRSRCYLGGRAVPAGLLAELAADLLAVHGQSDQLRLLRPPEQRAALDRFAGAEVLPVLARYREVFARWQAAAAELVELTERARERAREAELLRHGLEQVAAVAPVAGEEEDLAAEVSRLSHAELLRHAASQAHALLTSQQQDEGEGGGAGYGGGVLGGLAEATRAVQSAGAHDTALAAIGGRLADAGYLLSDVALDLVEYAAQVEADPAALAAAQERQAALRRLIRLYGADSTAVLGWAGAATTRLAELESDDDRRGALAASTAALHAELGSLAAELSTARSAAAIRFATAVTAELAALAMPAARIQVAVRQRDDADGLLVTGPLVAARRVSFGPQGVDEVEMLLTAHPGAPERPVARGASGGELSRVMLAIEVVFAEADPVPTMIFDEVDAGVGGAAAVEVGRRLARLARTHQVVCVTHLPQVAAFADRHLLVAKSDDGRITRAGVSVLDRGARVRELSRMLAGLADSALAQGHAEELLALAAATPG
ncbi:MAG: DNA repair protein RecN [Mycobacteriales bacterium]